MRVLHVIPGLSNASGPTRVVINLSDELVRLGCEVSIFHLKGRGYGQLMPEDERVKVKGFPVKWCDYWGYSPGLKHALSQEASSFAIIHIHSLWLYPNVAAVSVASRLGIPYVIRPAGSLMAEPQKHRSLRKRLYAALKERRHLNGAAAVHVASGIEAKSVSEFGVRAPIVTVPNGIPGARLRPMAASVSSAPTDDRTCRKVLFLGRLHPIKGLDLLARAFGKVARSRKDVHLIIAGPEGKKGYRSTVERYLRDEGVLDKTVFTGELEGERKWQAYREADVFVLPSRSENFGIAVAEAMASGIPVVVSQETPWQDVETRKAGFWVPLDAQKFAEAIITILDQPRLAAELSRNGCALVREKYTWDRIAKKMLHVYENIVNGRRPSAGLDEFN